jgi:sugar phosphate permease
VIGVIAIIAAQILRSSVAGLASATVADRISESGPAAVLYLLALAVLYRFTNKYTTLLMVICAAVAGQFIFLPQSH